MNDYPVEQGLFDDALEIGSCATDVKKPDPVTEASVDWSDDFEQLENLIGSEAALKVAGAFAGSTIYIPKNILTIKNYQAIRKEYRAGATYRELSVKYEYTETHIRNIIHRKKSGT